MVDIVDSATRSRMMAGIKGKNTRPELLVRRFLHAQGFRYRLHVSSLPGKPDIVLPKYQLAIFVNGCFWHRHHDCKYATIPEKNREKWQVKFRQNLERDQKQLAQLSDLGWSVVVIWECGLRNAKHDLSWMTEYIRQGGHLRIIEWPRQVKFNNSNPDTVCLTNNGKA
jgi:DNA mismatch endonuclease (patch repair protein)